MYVVVGSTGKVGGVVAQTLLSQGKQVRALVRDESKAASLKEKGAELFTAALEDGSQLEAAFHNVEGVFVMTPPYLNAPDPLIENRMALAAIKHALLAAHVPKVVFLSSVGAEHDRGTGAILKLHEMEQEIFSLSMNAASVRAAYFMENFLPLAGLAKETGNLFASLDPVDKTIPMVATKDIGELCAKLLVDMWQGHRIIELEGPQQYSVKDAASVLSKTLGRTVTPLLLPQEERKGFYEKAGFTSKAADTMTEMADGFNSGLISFTGKGADHVRGTTTLEEVLSKQ